MTIPIVASALCGLLFLIEKAMPWRRKSGSTEDWDKGSLAGIKFASALVLVGVVIGYTDLGRIQTGRVFIAVSGMLTAFVGVFLRWEAILTLKQYFTLDVAILEDHRIVRRGLYRHIRHPSYTGFLLRYLGGGLAFSNWLSLLIIFLPMLVAILYRIKVEERALTQSFGRKYIDYARVTSRLIPKIY